MSSTWRERLRHALTYRLAVWYAVLFLGSSGALAGLTYVLLDASLQERDREIIQSTSARYAAAYEEGGLLAVEAAIQAEQATGRYEPLLVRVLGRRRDVVFLSMPNDWSSFDLAALSTPALLGAETWATVPGPAGTTLEIGSARLADGTLFQVGKSTESRRELLVRFRRVLLIDLLTLVLIAGIGGALLTYSGLQPVRELTRAVRETLSTGQLRARVPVGHTNDALDELSGLFNEMLNRIEGLVAGMRGALDNVSHDLRTPIARLRGTAEGALQSPPDLAVYREALTDCIEESDRLVTMLNTLMDISEAETGAMRLDLEPLNLGEAIRDAVVLYEDVAEEKGVDVRVTVPDTLTLVAERNRLRQSFANLVDNAIKYNRRGGEVAITAGVDAATAVIEIRDTGIGIPPADLPRIWERLYRGDASRSERGLGLGLSLVKAIVEAHGGSVAVDSTTGVGTVFRIALPRASAGGAGQTGGAGKG